MRTLIVVTGAEDGTVIVGSFLDRDTHSSLQEFRARLGQSASLHVVHLVPSKATRDDRRVRRPKPTSMEWRDSVDAGYTQSVHSLRDNATDFHYIRIDSTDQTVDETVAMVKAAIPEVYGDTAQRQ